MKISIYLASYNPAVGYGVAAKGLIESLQRLGHTVYNDSPEKADVHISMSQPLWGSFTDKCYSISYTPWESSALPQGWTHAFSQFDEVWTTSPQAQQWYLNNDVNCTTVLQHGIDDMWTTQLREEGMFKFLDVAQPRARVNTQLVVDAFVKGFYKSKETSLVIKSIGSPTVRLNGKPVHAYPGIKVIDEVLSDTALVDLYHRSNCLTHISAGEGFSLAPFQAIASGMPTITTAYTVPYKDYLLPQTNIWSENTTDEHEFFEHPGEVLYTHDMLDEVIDKMRYVRNNYSWLRHDAYDAGVALKEDYQWDDLVAAAFDDLEERL